MQIQWVNNLERQLDKFKRALPREYAYSANIISDEDTPALENLKLKISEVEDLLMDLKINNNSTIAKLKRWFKTQVPTFNIHAVDAFHLAGTEKEFTLMVDFAKAFNLNLSDSQDQAYFQSVIGPRIDLFWLNHEPTWLQGTSYTGILSFMQPSLYRNSVLLRFKPSKRLTKDDAILNQVMTEIITKLWDHCQKFAKP